ncbi:hypothetical protein IJE86_02940 [bacterium]|nr:hypothetical protein [bacterium]
MARPTLANFKVPSKAPTCNNRPTTVLSFTGGSLATNAKKVTVNVFNKNTSSFCGLPQQTAIAGNKLLRVPLNFYNPQTKIPFKFNSNANCANSIWDNGWNALYGNNYCCGNNKLSGFEKLMMGINAIGPNNAIGLLGVGAQLFGGLLGGAGSIIDGIVGAFGGKSNIGGFLGGLFGGNNANNAQQAGQQAGQPAVQQAGTAPVSTTGGGTTPAATTPANAPSTSGGTTAPTSAPAPSPTPRTTTPAPTSGPTPAPSGKGTTPATNTPGAGTTGPQPDIPNPASGGAGTNGAPAPDEIKNAESALQAYQSNPTTENRQKLIEAQQQLQAKASEVKGQLTTAQNNYNQQEQAYNLALASNDKDKATVSTAERSLEEATAKRKGAEGFAQEKKAEVDGAQSDVQTAQEAFDSAEASITADRSLLATKEMARPRNASPDSEEYKNWATEVKTLREKIAREESELKTKEKAITEAKDKLKTAKDEYGKAEKALKEANTAEQKAQKELNGANQALQASADAMNAANAERQKAQSELNALDTTYRDIEVALGQQPQGIPEEA